MGADELSKLSSTDIAISSTDMDGLSESQRLQMCQKITQIVPEKDIQLLGNIRAAKSRIFSTVIKSNETSDRILHQAFVCPTKPQIFTYFEEDVEVEEHYNIFATIRKDEIKLQDSDILSYKIVQVRSIDVKEMTANDLPGNTSNEIGGLSMLETNDGNSSPRVTFNRDAAIGMDQLLPDERKKICKKAIELIAGQNVEFSNDSDIKPSQHYAIELDQEWVHVMQAFQCPTNPPVYLHVTRRFRGHNELLLFVKGEAAFENMISQLK